VVALRDWARGWGDRQLRERQNANYTI
jgi:hypothetical protein